MERRVSRRAHIRITCAAYVLVYRGVVHDSRARVNSSRTGHCALREKMRGAKKTPSGWRIASRTSLGILGLNALCMLLQRAVTCIYRWNLAGKVDAACTVIPWWFMLFGMLVRSVSSRTITKDELQMLVGDAQTIIVIVDVRRRRARIIVENLYLKFQFDMESCQSSITSYHILIHLPTRILYSYFKFCIYYILTYL